MSHNKFFNTSFDVPKRSPLESGVAAVDKDMLHELTTWMPTVRYNAYYSSTDAAKNRNIPAGHTYLAQFLAHDLNHSDLAQTNFDPMIGSKESDQPVARIDLAHIYGEGPGRSSMLYEPEKGTHARWRLALGAAVSPTIGKVVACPAARHMIVTDTPFATRPELDLPRRIQCPQEHQPSWARTDGTAIIADPRNDENLLISQMTCLFMRAHNKIASVVSNAILENLEGNERAMKSREVFPIAKRMLLLVYHRIVLDDFLGRMLDPAVHKRLRNGMLSHSEKDFLLLTDPRRGFRVPKIFSRAAFRIGHVMAQNTYRISNTFSDDALDEGFELHTLLKLINIVREDSSERILPVSDTWIVDWRRFFFDPTNLLDGEDRLVTGERVNFSHPIRLSCAESLVGEGSGPFATDDGKHGVPYMDLARALSENVPTAQQLLKEMPGLVCSEKRLENSEIANALTASGASEKARIALSSATPLLVYLILEAEKFADGERLGPLGSIIIGEVLIGAMMSAHLPPDAVDLPGEILDAEPHRRRAREEWFEFLDRAPPATMSALVDFVTEVEN